MTHMESCLLVDLGKAVTKSIVMCSHFQTGISSDCSFPAGLLCSTWICWQVRHLAIISATYLFMPAHRYCLFRSLYILVLPGCMTNLEEWCSRKTSSRQAAGT